MHAPALITSTIVAFLCITAPTWAAPGYFNERFGYGLRLPGGYVVEDRGQRTDAGATFSSADGKVVINVFGAENASRRSISALLGEYRRKAPDARFTYQWQRGNSGVLSGYEGGDIFYVRIALSPDRSRVAVLSMTYARDVKRRLDPIVARLSRSLFIE